MESGTGPKTPSRWKLEIIRERRPRFNADAVIQLTDSTQEAI